MTQFEKVTESREVLGAFLAALPVIDGPWDTEFHKRFCADYKGRFPLPDKRGLSGKTEKKAAL